MKKTTFRVNAFKHAFLLFLTVSLLISCDGTKSFKPVSVQGIYSVEVPGYMTETNTLNSDASLQYQNAVKEVYLIVINESKDELYNSLEVNGLGELYSYDLDGYANLLIDAYTESIEVTNRSEISDVIINGLNARTYTMSAIVDGVNAYIKMAYIEGNDNFYTVMSWTLYDRKDKYRDDLNAMVNSFREL